jgi:hypothetical protein
MHGVLHALPLTYNKDMQEDKEPLFDAVDTLELCLAAAQGMVAGARFDRERMAAAASDELIAATDLADLLVKRGTPFREAHGVVAGLVREAVESGRTLRDVAIAQLGEDAAAVLEQLVVARVEGLRGRDGAAAGARAARARPRAARAVNAAFYDRPVLDVAADLVGCDAAPRRQRGHHRRDRGVPHERGGLPRLRRPHRAHVGPLRLAGAGLRLPLVRHPRAAQRRSASRARSARPSSSGRSSRPRASRRCGCAAARSPTASCATARGS